MPMINTYGTLKDSVKNWLNRSDDVTVQSIPYFINFATIDFQRTIQLPQYEVSRNYVMYQDNIDIDPTVTLDDDYFEMKHFTVNDQPYNRVDVDTFYRIKTENRQNGSSTSNLFSGDEMKASEKNFYFARVANKIMTIPEFKDGDKVQMIYWKEMPEMVSDSDNPDYLLVGPDIMLYLSLRHAAVFLRDNDQAQFWEQKAAESAQGLMKRLDTVEWSGSALVVKEFRN